MAGFLASAGLTGSLLAWNDELEAALSPALFRAATPAPVYSHSIHWCCANGSPPTTRTPGSCTPRSRWNPAIRSRSTSKAYPIRRPAQRPSCPTSSVREPLHRGDPGRAQVGRHRPGRDEPHAVCLPPAPIAGLGNGGRLVATPMPAIQIPVWMSKPALSEPRDLNCRHR